MENQDLKQILLDAISKLPVGETLQVNFRGLAVPIKIEMVFAGGWAIKYTLVPGMPLELTKGSDEVPVRIDITILPKEDFHLKE